jgi:hypothetical protein
MSSEIEWDEAIKLVVKAEYGPTQGNVLTLEELDLIDRLDRGKLPHQQPGILFQRQRHAVDLKEKAERAQGRKLERLVIQEPFAENWLRQRGFQPQTVNLADLDAKLREAYPGFTPRRPVLWSFRDRSGAARGQAAKPGEWIKAPDCILTLGQEGVLAAHNALWPDGKITQRARERDMMIIDWLQQSGGKFPTLEPGKGSAQPTIRETRTKIIYRASANGDSS